MALPQQGVNQSSLAVVHMGDDGDVANSLIAVFVHIIQRVNPKYSFCLVRIYFKMDHVILREVCGSVQHKLRD